MATDIPTPRGLKAAGRKLWKQTVEAYELRQDELEVLKAACQESDLIVKIEGELETASLTVLGSTGQIVTHPLIPEVRQHRATLAALLRSLKLPEDSTAGQSNQQRAAAQSRWAAAHGRSA